MDDEQSFAALLRSTTPAARPTWDAPGASGPGAGASGTSGMSADPWANPFAASPPQPFAAPSVPRVTAVPDLPSPSFGSMSMSSPYDAYGSSGAGATGGNAGFGSPTRGNGAVEDTAAAFGGMGISSASARALVEDQKESPYVQQLESEGITSASGGAFGDSEGFGEASRGFASPDPPSVIAAREQEALSAQQAFSHDEEPSVPTPAAAYISAQAEPTMEDDPFAQPFASPSRPFIANSAGPASPPLPPFTVPSDSPPAQKSPSAGTQAGPASGTMSTPTKKLPAGLIDDDLLAESDPMLSLKKAFVKSAPAAPAPGDEAAKKDTEKGRASPAPRARAADKAKKTFVFGGSPKKTPASLRKPAEAKKEESESAKKAAIVKETLLASSPTHAVPATAESSREGQSDPDSRAGDGQAEPKVIGDEAKGGQIDTAKQDGGPPKASSTTEAREEAGPVQNGDGESLDDESAVVENSKQDANTVEESGKGTSEQDKTGDTSTGQSEPAAPVAPDNEDSKAVDAPQQLDVSEEPTSSSTAVSPQSKRQSLRPTAIPLPASTLTSPGLSRQVSPMPDSSTSTSVEATVEVEAPSPSKINTAPPDAAEPTPAVQTPYDRVAVSPLDGPARQTSGFEFSSDSASASASAVVRDQVVREAGDAWGDGPLSGPSQGRFSAKGWGAVDVDDEDLFGRKADPWGGDEVEHRGWEEEAGRSTSSFHSPVLEPTEAPEQPSAYQVDEHMPAPTSARTSPIKPKRKTHPVFTVSVGDPTRVGDPVRGYTVYTIRTHTTSPHYRKSDLSALRRFSDFLWLVEALTANNPGIIIPPVPDKHTFGRFQEQFIETRRMALERSLTKITAHPVLQLDPDLRLFLESDNFSVESKARRPVIDAAPEQRGLLSGWTGPRFVESDDWFVSRLAFLDSLEAQLRGLSKSVEVSSKARLDYAIALGESADSMARLAESDLGSAMCAALARLADLGRTEKETAEELAKGDVVNLLNTADEYIRFIGSVRVAMQARTKGWFAWQMHVKEASRFKATREKMRAQGKLGDRAAQSLAEANELDRRAADAERDFETTSKVIKSEFARFERERVEEFKRALERWLDVQITRQKEVIEAWEEYHGVVLKMVQKAQGIRAGREQ